MVRNGKGKTDYEFTLLLAGIDCIDARVEDALFEAGCDDATLSARSGRVYLTFSRSAPSLKRAILGAIHNVHAADIGAMVLRVDVCDLMTQSDIARKIGRTRQLVNQYIAGARGPGSFPAPACNVADGAPLWYWSEVAHWLWQNNLVDQAVHREAREVAVINSVLDLQRQRQADPALTKEVMKELNSS